MAYDHTAVSAAIEQSLKLDFDLGDSTNHDVAFHMTDWLDDLDRYARFCADPSSVSRKATVELLLRFLGHVPDHLVAAARLAYGDPVTDVFGVGAVLGDGIARPDADE